jgi:YbbR domain-containing protein
MRFPALRSAPLPPSSESSGPPPLRPTPPWRRLLRVPRARDLRAALRKDPGLKLISLLLAFFLWFSINVSERDAERDVKLPVTIRKLPASLIVTNLPTSPVIARVHGPRTILEGVDTRDTRVALDLSGFSAGDRMMELTPDMVRPELPRRLKVTRLEPGRLKLHIEALVSRELPVHADVGGIPALGYTIAGSSVSPAEVRATGPASRVNDLKELRTETVDVTGASGNVDRDNVLLSWAGDFVTFASDRVKVDVVIKQVMMAREFPHVEVKILHAGAARLRLTPPTVDLTLSGPQRTLHNYELPEGAVYVDVEGLKPGDYDMTPRIDLPPALTVESRKPEKLRLRILGHGRR